MHLGRSDMEKIKLKSANVIMILRIIYVNSITIMSVAQKELCTSNISATNFTYMDFSGSG